MRLSGLIFFLIILPLIIGGSQGDAQKVKTEVVLLDDYLMLESGEIPLPKNGVELKPLFARSGK